MALEDDVDRALEFFADAVGQRGDGIGLDAQHAARERDGTTVGGSGNWVHGIDALH